MRFELIVLGTNGAVPAYGRHCSAHFLRTEREDFLIDCGEGTQLQLQRAGLGMGRCDHIFISHLHGDHYFGLPGLLTSLMLNDRKKKLTITSPPGLRERLEKMLELDRYAPPFELVFREITATELTTVLENDRVTVGAFPLRHRIATNGYLVREKRREANIIGARIAELGIPFERIPAIKAGEDFTTAGGTRIPHAELTTPAAPPRSYAYCSDTIYFSEIVEFVKGVDLLYHEATFLHERAADAREKGHATAREAATVAAAAGVGRLVLGHFSGRYPEVSLFEEEAREVFAESYAARDLYRYAVDFKTRAARSV